MGKLTVKCKRCGEIINETFWAGYKGNITRESVHELDCEDYKDVQMDKEPV